MRIDAPTSFPLRMPRSTRQKAKEIATLEGLSLNQFITLAVAEKVARLESFAEDSVFCLACFNHRMKEARE
jgi:hypothetical protein